MSHSTPSRTYLLSSVSDPSRAAAPAAARSAPRSGPSCSCRLARAPLPRGSFPVPSLAAFAFASPSSQAPGSASPCPPRAQRATTQRREAARRLGALRESDAAGDPGSGAPLPRSPAASAVRALLRSCAIPVECAQRRSQRPRREVCPSGVCAPLRAQPLPAARRPRLPCRRPQCPAPPRARPRVSGPGRGLAR